ncbi:sterol-binding protein [Luteibacter rhizovicinus DSM 16549]|uniref:Ubiquinone biosynthesis accessory factor UbiJ n=1 Tax=Luteibacter rhizovicinus DSM 16549 TaxID=1440763 RepID=A0A1L3EZ73_9GAMM|nr:SCP2 sterol-binding domain-containing protein [Luteibacter rhizovicinus]APG06366.1 sterol-binding protein [Luteibacter rhizovicinus DSM 16549]KLD77232.1 sterol-binding protein [Xanthomonas hyacinthi DSM 19077]
MTSDRPSAEAGPNRFLPRPLRVLAGRAMEAALNRAVDLDPDTRSRLDALDGRSVQVHLSGPELALRISVQKGRLRVGPPEEGGSLRVTASPGSLLAMAIRRDDDGVAPGKVDIAGDAELARRLEKLTRHYAPDVEEAFAKTFGDTVGVPLAKAFRDAFAHARETVSHLTEDGADWLRDEGRVAVAPGEADAFLDGVDDVRERTERAEARLARLERALKGRHA